MNVHVKKIKTANVITLGCSKNLVDSEVMMRQLAASGIETKHDDNTPADLVIINTCGFINDAKEESVNTILEWANERKEGNIAKLFVMGCLSQRYRDELIREMPEVDGFFGVNDMNAILDHLNAPLRKDLLGERVLTTPSHYAYLKVSEGCNRHCSFCAIPSIRGKNVSKPVEELVAEARFLAQQGVKELILIAQDLTNYGIDLNRKRQLPDLVKELSNIEEIRWIRLHYAYPLGFPLRILDIMNNNPKVCRYLDIPLQHINDRILKSMHRGLDSKRTRSLVKTIRERVPGIAIRTSFIAGYPGETTVEFNELRDFIVESRFERMGVFTYSHEENTPAAKLIDSVRPAQKAKRASQLMEIQQQIAVEANEALHGQVLKVIIDRKEDKLWIGRTEFDSPEVDNEVLITDATNSLKPGDFVDVRITGTAFYDLEAAFPA